MGADQFLLIYPFMFTNIQICSFDCLCFQGTVGQKEIHHAYQKPSLSCPAGLDSVDVLIHLLGISASLHNVPFPTQPRSSTM